MKSLLILRHARASAAMRGQNDHERPLDERGQRDARAVGQRLAAADLLPDLILASSAARTVETARLVAESGGFSGELRPESALYLAPARRYLELLAGLAEGAPRVMVVGHNPGLELLVERLTRRPEELPTAALALVELPIERWDALHDGWPRGRLAQLWRPDHGGL